MAKAKVTREVPAGLYELMEAVGLAKPYEWHISMRRGEVSAQANLGREVWTIVHTPQSQPAPAWQVTRAGVTIGGADSAIDAMALVLVKHREELDRWRSWAGDAMALVTMRITELVDEDQAARNPEVRREPQGAGRRNNETALAPQTEPAPQPIEPDQTQDRAWQRQMMRYEALLDETDLSREERETLRDQVCAKRHVPSLTQLLPSALQEVCDWLQKAGPAQRGPAVRLQLAAKRAG